MGDVPGSALASLQTRRPAARALVEPGLLPTGSGGREPPSDGPQSCATVTQGTEACALSVPLPPYQGGDTESQRGTEASPGTLLEPRGPWPVQDGTSGWLWQPHVSAFPSDPAVALGLDPPAPREHSASSQDVDPTVPVLQSHSARQPLLHLQQTLLPPPGSPEHTRPLSSQPPQCCSLSPGALPSTASATACPLQGGPAGPGLAPLLSGALQGLPPLPGTGNLCGRPPLLGRPRHAGQCQLRRVPTHHTSWGLEPWCLGRVTAAGAAAARGPFPRATASWGRWMSLPGQGWERASRHPASLPRLEWAIKMSRARHQIQATSRVTGSPALFCCRCCSLRERRGKGREGRGGKVSCRAVPIPVPGHGWGDRRPPCRGVPSPRSSASAGLCGRPGVALVLTCLRARWARPSQPCCPQGRVSRAEAAGVDSRAQRGAAPFHSQVTGPKVASQQLRSGTWTGQPRAACSAAASWATRSPDPTERNEAAPRALSQGPGTEGGTHSPGRAAHRPA